MSKTLFNRINIFLKVNEGTINAYFNVHDPAAAYKRQLSQEFEEYIMNYSIGIKRHSIVTYKIVIEQKSDIEFVDPLIHAIRRHFSLRKSIKEGEFRKFKRRSLTLLFMSMAVIIVCLGLVPSLFKEEHWILGVMKESLHIVSWVMLMNPIEKLIFGWNPYLKEISILDKLTNAEMVLIDKLKVLSVEYAA